MVFAAGLLLATPALCAELAEKLNPADVKDVSSEIVYRASLGRADDIKLLLDMGASPNQSNDDGSPVFSLAAARRDPEGMVVAKTLMARGANIHAKDANGQNALFYAVRSGTPEMLTWLLESKVDYYAPDNDGNIARNIALQTDKPAMAQLMDDFVNAQAAKVKQQHEEYNKAVNAQYNEQQRAQQEAEEKARAEQEARQSAYRDKLQKQGSDEFTAATSDLAYNNCAFQYWSYVASTKQKTELSADELEIAIDSHRQHIVTATGMLEDAFAADQARLEMLSSKSKQLVFDQLDSMLSKTERFEKGVGRMQDMKQRCSEIAKHWETMPVAIRAQDDSSAQSQ